MSFGVNSYVCDEAAGNLLNTIDDTLIRIERLLQVMVAALPTCESCKKPLTFTEQKPEPCPFASEIHGDNTPRLMCGTCRYSAAQDI